MSDTPPLVRLIDGACRSGYAPTASQIRDAADFRQSGGIARLCEALSFMAARAIAEKQGRRA